MVPSGRVGGAFERFVALLDDVEDYYTTGVRRAAEARTKLVRTDSTEGGTALPSSTSAADALEQVASEVAECRQCGLCDTRTNTVPGEGALAPLVVVIGEGPGRDEDLSGRPFVGPAGQYLDRWLAAIDLDRGTNAYIANVVKCRPPNNRDPAPEESAACIPYLRRQIAALRPRALLSVGRIASQTLTGSGIGIGAMRGQVYTFQTDDGPTIPLVVTYHPSGVLRNPRLREPVWDDLRTLQRIVA